jgi:D-alanyl-D-alanine carboxypeptidase (penicillin-binding protein 5/6)
MFTAPTPALALSGEPELTEAQAAYLMTSGGEVLYEKNAYEELAPASITKIMTAMVALDAGIPLDTPVTVGAISLDGEAQQAGFKEGSTTTFGDLMQVLLVFSANDAAQLIAREVAGSEEAFAQLMNEKAAELGMEHTTFKNASGLDAEGHLSCARDLAVMGQYALAHYPYIAQTVEQSSCTIAINDTQMTFKTTDQLLGVYPGMRGIKTGVGLDGTTFLGANAQDSASLISCVLGCDTSWGRFQDTMNLYNWAYAQRVTLTLTRKGQIVDYVAFPWRFGMSYPVAATATTQARVWDSGASVDWTRLTVHGAVTLTGNQTAAVALWQQSGATVAAAIWKTGAYPVMVPAHNVLYWLPLTGHMLLAG